MWRPLSLVRSLTYISESFLRSTIDVSDTRLRSAGAEIKKPEPETITLAMNSTRCCVHRNMTQATLHETLVKIWLIQSSRRISTITYLLTYLRLVVWNAKTSTRWQGSARTGQLTALLQTPVQLGLEHWYGKASKEGTETVNNSLLENKMVSGASPAVGGWGQRGSGGQKSPSKVQGQSPDSGWGG